MQEHWSEEEGRKTRPYNTLCVLSAQHQQFSISPATFFKKLLFLAGSTPWRLFFKLVWFIFFLLSIHHFMSKFLITHIHFCWKLIPQIMIHCRHGDLTRKLKQIISRENRHCAAQTVSSDWHCDTLSLSSILLWNFCTFSLIAFKTQYINI